MKIDNQFSVNVPIAEAWTALTDLERIAPCMPGAQLTGREGDAYLGTVKVKVGPVISEFAGTASFVEKDEAKYHAIIDAKGRDSRGSGNASATITAQLRSDGAARTTVVVETDMKISGKLAQFGSGMIAEVSSKLLGQFADSLEQLLATAPEAPGETDPAVTAAGPKPVDLTHLAGGAVAKRLLPVLAGIVVVAVIIYAIAR
jgi:carbon monoxide dehydrogenase subunit G